MTNFHFKCHPNLKIDITRNLMKQLKMFILRIHTISSNVFLDNVDLTVNMNNHQDRNALRNNRAIIVMSKRLYYAKRGNRDGAC